MKRPVAVVFVMPGEVGHFNRVRPVVAALVDEGVDVVACVDSRFHGDVERLGARFFDLFGRFPLEGLDDETQPPPSRFVTYAGHYGEEVVDAIAGLEPDVVVYDTFAVIGRVVARGLDVPAVNVCAGHDRVPERVMPEYLANPRYHTSERCHAAVERLRTVHGIEDAGHLSWIGGASATLNVYCEPPQFLSREGEDAFAPVAFFGSVWDRERPASPAPWPGSRIPGRRRLLVGMGSVAWRVFNRDARAVVEAVVDAVATREDVEALVTTGDRTPDADLAALSRANVRVVGWVDQWAALAGADVFVTHCGLNSTHEAIYHRVPMVTYPLFGDQPSLARFCASLGVAVPLVDGVRAHVTAAAVHAALDAVERERPRMEERLAEARGWEVDVIATRPETARKIAAIAAASRSAREGGQERDGTAELGHGGLVVDLALEP